jgi:hypothetical protein
LWGLWSGRGGVKKNGGAHKDVLWGNREW